MISARTLTDGGQRPADIARAAAAFLDGAQHSLDLALYDLDLGPQTEGIVLGALEAAAARGVDVRLAYNVDHRNPIPVPPPPACRPEDVERLQVPTRAVAGVPDLMHHKFVVRDRDTVWTGSTNWTDDSWSREENVIVTVESPELAQAYTLAFEQLWASGNVLDSGRVEPRRIEVGSVLVRPWFCPAYGDALSHRVAKAIGRARRRVRICSPVLSAAPVLATLAQATADGRLDLAGCIDQTQTEEVLRQWGENGVSGWKVPLLQTVLQGGAFSGKRSTAWAPGTVHDFMHAKVTVADDVVFCGSFNLSHSGERNAEDMLELHDAELADQLAAFVDEVRARYPAAEA
ncbi:MAG TPA: phospholipase D-like domain-containing protein [Gaiellaceae bacterium]|nr:phospholipase D-like domain-containing protein [Gaiellaceae bacterium]